MMKKKLILVGTIAVAILGSWAVLDHRNGHAQTAPAGPPQVTVARVMERPVSDSADFTGQLQAVNTVRVQPRVGGYVQAVPFTEGALVHKGDVLFRSEERRVGKE